MTDSQAPAAQRWGRAALVFFGLCFVSYLLTWPHWHPAERESVAPSANPSTTTAEPHDDVRLDGEQALFILPYAVQVSANETSGADSRSDCLAYTGNRALYLRHLDGGKTVSLRYMGTSDEPGECDRDREFSLPTADFIKLLAGSFAEAEREREREQAVRDRLGLPP
jgi:hypothetical protein